MWKWIKAKWAAFIGFSRTELTAEEQAAQREEEELIARYRARELAKRGDSPPIVARSTATTMGLKPASGSGGAQGPSQPADGPGTGKDAGPHNLGS